MKYTVEEFAQIVLEQTQTRLRGMFTDEQASWERVNVKPGPVYTKVDIGTEHSMSGKYMVENLTGVIYGIKAYGKVHKGHMYGTLDTVDEWWWGGYTGERRGDLLFFPGDRVICQDVIKGVVRGYSNIREKIVLIKGESGKSFEAHQSELRKAEQDN